MNHSLNSLTFHFAEYMENFTATYNYILQTYNLHHLIFDHLPGLIEFSGGTSFVSSLNLYGTIFQNIEFQYDWYMYYVAKTRRCYIPE